MVILTHCVCLRHINEVPDESRGQKPDHITNLVSFTQMLIQWKLLGASEENLLKGKCLWDYKEGRHPEKKRHIRRDNEGEHSPDILGGIPSLWRQLSTLRVVHWRVQYRNTHISILKTEEVHSVYHVKLHKTTEKCIVKSNIVITKWKCVILYYSL